MSRALTTTDRILDASLKLFNEQGFQSVPAMKIAQHLGMSPGHLAYHFKTKNDIVMAVFPRLEEEMRQDVLQAVKPGQPFTAADGAQHTVAVFRTLWRYRFIFDALNRLLADDAELRKRYLLLQESCISVSENVFKQLIRQEAMLPITPPSTPRSLAKSWWMMWLGWLRVEQIEYPHSEMPPTSAIFDGALQTHGIIQAYFSPVFSRAFLRELDKALRADADEPAPQVPRAAKAAKVAKPAKATKTKRRLR